MHDVLDEPECPRRGQRVSTIVGASEAGEQLAVDRLECPNCGARLVRDIEGHGDRRWRRDDETGD